MELLITIGGKEIIVPDTVINVWVVAILLIVFALVVNKKIKQAKAEDVPSGFLNLAEIMIEGVQGLVRSTMGEHNMRFAPFILTIFSFILIANLLGLVGLTPPTSDYSVTLSLALITFTLVQFWKIKTAGNFFKYLKSFLEPYVLLSPLNVIGELANPVSLSFRLFGNIMSGGLIMTLIYQALGYFAPFIAPPLHAYFDVFSGVLQAFIFTMLTMVFVSGATE